MNQPTITALIALRDIEDCGRAIEQAIQDLADAAGALPLYAVEFEPAYTMLDFFVSSLSETRYAVKDAACAFAVLLPPVSPPVNEQDALLSEADWAYDELVTQAERLSRAAERFAARRDALMNAALDAANDADTLAPARLRATGSAMIVAADGVTNGLSAASAAVSAASRGLEALDATYPGWARQS